MDAGKQLQVRPVLDSEKDATHLWSRGASEGEHTVCLDAVDESLMRLVACPPHASSVQQGENL